MKWRAICFFVRVIDPDLVIFTVLALLRKYGRYNNPLITAGTYRNVNIII